MTETVTAICLQMHLHRKPCRNKQIKTLVLKTATFGLKTRLGFVIKEARLRHTIQC